MRQARYFGRSKTLFQLLMAATVANLTLVAAKIGITGGQLTTPAALLVPHIASAAKTLQIRLGKPRLQHLWWIRLAQKYLARDKGFRPGF